MNSESRFEAQACRLLAKHGFITHKVPADLYPGYPDRIVIRADRAFYIEFKMPSGRLSKLQKHIHQQLAAQGIKVYIVRTIQDIKDILHAKR